MTSFRAAMLAAVLIMPGSAFAASDEAATAPGQPAAEQVLPAAESDRVAAQETAVAAGRESDAFARVPLPQSKPRSLRPSRASVARAAPPAQHYQYGCSGYWCGRQFVLMIGIGF